MFILAESVRSTVPHKLEVLDNNCIRMLSTLKLIVPVGRIQGKWYSRAEEASAAAIIKKLLLLTSSRIIEQLPHRAVHLVQGVVPSEVLEH